MNFQRKFACHVPLAAVVDVVVATVVVAVTAS